MSEDNTKKDSFNIKFSIKKKTVTIVSIVAVLLILILGLGIGIPLGLAAQQLSGSVSTEVWNSNAQFDENADSVVTLTKQKDKDFVILNLTDIQMSENYTIFQNNRNYKYISELVGEVKPDLITITGDNVWMFNTKTAAKKFTKAIDKLGIPWAPIFGNHDAENDVDKNWLVEAFNKSEHCLMRKGPMNIAGVGNYIINIKEEGSNKIVHTLFMMDSHMGAPETVIDTINIYDGAEGVEQIMPSDANLTWNARNGWLTKNGNTFAPILKEDGFNEMNPVTNKPIYKAIGYNYDYIKQNQIDWYKWAVKGIAELANNDENNTVPSSVLTHIAVPEFAHAYSEYVGTITNDDGTVKSIAELKELEAAGAENFGQNLDDVYCSRYNSGFFSVIQELKSTKNIIVGHDHINYSSIMYKGVRLTYALKTGDGCSWVEDGSVSGGTKLIVNSDGSTVTKHIYKAF